MTCDAEALRAWCARRGPVTAALSDRACVAWLAQRAEASLPTGINGTMFRFPDRSVLILTSDAATVQR